MLSKETLMALKNANIRLYAEVPHPCGSETVLLTYSDVEKFIDDPEGFVAAQKGVSRDDYLGWLESQGTPRCGALTKKGTRCKNWVSGGMQMRIGEWMNSNGGYCAVHGGESAEEAHLRIYGRKKY